VSYGDELPRLIWHPEHEVGEGHVGNNLPVGYEQVKPIHVTVRNGAMFLD
jgi:hypothetical protein